MAVRENLTDKRIAHTKPAPVGKRLTVWDSQVPGLGLRVTDKGTKSFVVMRRIKGAGTPKRWTLGKYPATRLAQARATARAWIDLIDTGKDPYAERDRARKEEERQNADSVGALFERFEAEHLSQIRTGQEVANAIRRDVLPAWGNRPVREISRRDVNDLLDKVAVEQGRHVANRRLSAIRRLLRHGMRKGWIDHNPATGAEKRAKERSRDRVLDENEIHEVWRAAARLGYPFGPFVQVLMLTAQRRTEVAKMRWPDIDTERRVWTIPSEFSKSDRHHDVPLSNAVIELLEELPRLKDSDWVFTTNGQTAISGFSKAKTRLVRSINERRAEEQEFEGGETEGMPDWRLHDFRRTAASYMAQLDVPPHVLSAVLNHSPGSVQGITAIYNRYRYTDEKRSALESWAEKLAEIAQD
jgi:integrase